MALSDLVLDCKFHVLPRKILKKITFCFLVYEIINAGRVDMSDFELLKVLGTGGKKNSM